jgi:lipopolysaccharide/colanic/teichoic acid biosynthesis glycosyltransferase
MRRLFDILVAVLALVALAPLLLMIALAVRIDSPGNPIYLGWRVGAGGRGFRMWKFRTMVQGAARLGAAITNHNDPRITRLGRLLRKTKLDELPQFVNVLRGDMTLVGPRPEAPEIVAMYTPSQRAVLRAKPGITGCVQLEAGEEAARIPQGSHANEYYVRHLMEHKIRRDIEYLESRTFWSDLQIVLATAGLVLGSFRPMQSSSPQVSGDLPHGSDSNGFLSPSEYRTGRN